jgi:hypothetical protein
MDVMLGGARVGSPSEEPVRSRSWRTAVAEFGTAIDGAPAPVEEQITLPLDVGVVGLTGVGKSSLLNALVAPGFELLPSGGVGPLTGTAVRIGHAAVATLRVKYLGRSWLLNALRKLNSSVGLSNSELGRLSFACTGDQYKARDREWLARALRYALHPDVAMPPDESRDAIEALHGLHKLLEHGATEHRWTSDAPDGAFFRRVHDHVSGRRAALCERVEVGWPCPLLETGLGIVDLPGVGTSADSYASRAAAWMGEAKAVLVVTDRAGVAESVVTCLRGSGFLQRVAEGRADLIGVVTKLDQVTDDLRRQDRAQRKWSSYFRSVVDRAEAELLGQLGEVLRVERGTRGGGAFTRIDETLRVFGVSSREHQRIVERDDADRPRLHLAESTGIPAVRRALTALARLRSSTWTSALFDRIRAAPDSLAHLTELIALVDMEGT